VLEQAKAYSTGEPVDRMERRRFGRVVSSRVRAGYGNKLKRILQVVTIFQIVAGVFEVVLPVNVKTSDLVVR
jgi:hypothetical protein